MGTAGVGAARWEKPTEVETGHVRDRGIWDPGSGNLDVHCTLWRQKRLGPLSCSIPGMTTKYCIQESVFRGLLVDGLGTPR